MKVLAIKCINTIEDFEKPSKTSRYTPKVYKEWDGKRGKSKYSIPYVDCKKVFKETDNVVYLGIVKGD